MSSFSALAEYPDRVRSLFKQHELSEVCVLLVCRWFGVDFPLKELTVDMNEMNATF